MRRLIITCAFLCGWVFNTYSQTEAPKEKKFNHYLGFQANELIRQIINLNNNSSAVTNPYLAVYSINHSKTGWGVHAGFGYDYNRIVNNEVPASRETKVNHLFYRIGAEKKFTLSKRFEGIVALDFASAYETDKTFSISVTNVGSGIDSAVTTVSEKTTSIGGGPMLALNYYISERLIISTEATLYYHSEKQKENVNIVDTFTDIFNNNEQTITTTNQNSGTDTDRFKLTIPAAIFLIIKF